YAPSLYSFHPALPFLPLLRRQPPRPTLFPYTTLFRSDQRSGTDGDRVGAKGNGLGNVGACANTTGNDEFHLAVHIHFLQSFDGLAHSGQGRNADIFDKDFLGRSSSTLHPVNDDDIGAGGDGQFGVVVGSRGCDFHVNGFFPVGDFAQFLNLQGQVVRTGPVWVTARRALVDTLGQGPHCSDTFGDLLAQQHSGATWFCTLADDHFNGVGFAQVIWVHPVARGQQLVD